MKTNGTPIEKWANTQNDQTPYYLAVVDAEGSLSFTNSRFYSSFQAALKPEMQNRFFDLVHENDRPQLTRALECCSSRDEAITTEARIKNGHFRWVKWEISGIQKPVNMSGKFLCLGYDITPEEQPKKTVRAFEQNYQASNALFHSFMDHTNSFTWVADEEGCLMFGNRAFLEHFQLDESAFGKELTGILPETIAGILSEKHSNALKSDKPDHSMVRSRAADGSEMAYHLTVFPVRGNTPGRMVGGEAHCL
jgi:PAS domain S-box-containing protein